LRADVLKYATDELSFGAGQMGDLNNYLDHLQKIKVKHRWPSTRRPSSIRSVWPWTKLSARWWNCRAPIS
jgi:hypothetical protein